MVGGVDDIVNMIKLYKQLHIKVACLIDADVIFCKPNTLKNIYKELTSEELTLGTKTIISQSDVDRIVGFCKQCKNCPEGFGRSIMNFIKEKGGIVEYRKSIKLLNDKGIYFFNKGDFEANFTVDFVSNNLSRDKKNINKEKLAYAIKYKAETETSERFEKILSDGAKQDLENSFNLIKDYFKEEKVIELLKSSEYEIDLF